MKCDMDCALFKSKLLINNNMKFIKHLFNYFGINCWLTSHDWTKYETYEGCKKCPAIKVKQGGKDIIL